MPQSSLAVSSSFFFLAFLSLFPCIAILFRHIKLSNKSRECSSDVPKRFIPDMTRHKAIVVISLLSFLCMLRGVLRLSAYLVQPAKARQGLLDADTVLGAFVRFALCASLLYLILRIFCLSSKLQKRQNVSESSLKPWYIVCFLFTLVCATLTAILHAIVLSSLPPLISPIFTLVAVLILLPVLVFAVAFFCISFFYGTRQVAEKHVVMSPQDLSKSPASTTFLVPPEWKSTGGNPVRNSARLRAIAIVSLAVFSGMCAIVVASIYLASVSKGDSGDLVVVQTLCEASWAWANGTLIALLSYPSSKSKSQKTGTRSSPRSSPRRANRFPSAYTPHIGDHTEIKPTELRCDEMQADQSAYDLSDDPFAPSPSPIEARYTSFPERTKEPRERLSAQWGAIPVIPPPAETRSRQNSDSTSSYVTVATPKKAVTKKRSLTLRSLKALKIHHVLSPNEGTANHQNLPAVNVPNRAVTRNGKSNKVGPATELPSEAEVGDPDGRHIEGAMLAQLLLRSLESSSSIDNPGCQNASSSA